MGGDGGVVATNRRYLRGAGVADHTGDSLRASASDIAKAEKERLQQMMKTCAITGNPLSTTIVVACPYGRLYDKEAAIQALLKRQSSKEEDNKDDIGWHVRGMKDLYPVHFHFTTPTNQQQQQAICPITSMELNGIHPALLMIQSSSKKEDPQQPNVISEKALQEMGMEALQQEYGPIDRFLRLAPTMANGIFDQICQEWEQHIQNEDAAKKKKRKKKHKHNKKNKQPEEPKMKQTKRNHTTTTCNNNKAVDTARSNIAAAVSSNTVFSSLFQTKRGPISDKEKRDNLFVR